MGIRGILQRRERDWRAQECEGSEKCDGCSGFINDLTNTELGRDALYKRFNRPIRPETGVNFGSIKVCVKHNNGGFPFGVCDAGISSEDPKIAEVAIVVHPNYQGRGFASQLFSQMKKTLVSRGVGIVYSEISINNKVAQDVARSLGAERIIQKNGAIMDEDGRVYWQKRIK